MDLPKTPDLTYTPHPPTEAEQLILTLVRPYMDDPEMLFKVLDGLVAYYHDELAS